VCLAMRMGRPLCWPRSQKWPYFSYPLPHGNESTFEADEMIELLKKGFDGPDDYGGSLDDEGAWFMRIGDTTWVGVEGTVLWPPSRTATTTAATTPATATTVTTTTTTAAKPAPPAKPPAVSDSFKGQKLSKLDPGDWTDGAACAPGDRAIDAILAMASARIQGDFDVGALRKGFAAAGATRAPDHKPEAGWDEELWRFADGSGLLIARDNTDGVCKVWIKGPDGEQFDFDPAKDDLFHLPLTPDPRSAAAGLDHALLVGNDAAQELGKRGFVAESDRVFVHQDGSWAVIVPQKKGAPWVAAGVGDRRYELDAAQVARAPALGALPPAVQKMVKLSAPLDPGHDELATAIGQGALHVVREAPVGQLAQARRRLLSARDLSRTGQSCPEGVVRTIVPR
jgi:hypothetical protein